jgi:hypothetical protein
LVLDTSQIKSEHRCREYIIFTSYKLHKASKTFNTRATRKQNLSRWTFKNFQIKTWGGWWLDIFLLFTTVVISNIREWFQKITLSAFSLQYKNINFFSNGLIAPTSSMLCLFLDQNKDNRPEDGFPASNFNRSYCLMCTRCL